MIIVRIYNNTTIPFKSVQIKKKNIILRLIYFECWMKRSDMLSNSDAKIKSKCVHYIWVSGKEKNYADIESKGLKECIG